MVDQEHKKHPAVSQARSLLIDFDLTLDQYHPRLNKIIKKMEPLKLLWENYFFVDAVQRTVQ